MSLAQLFFMKETFRAQVRHWRQSCFRQRSNSSPVTHRPSRLISLASRFTLESLEPRLLLSATPTEVIATQALEPAAITVPVGSLPNFDVDLNGQADALSDGIVIIRHLFGFTGNALTDGAVDSAGQRTDPTAIQNYLNSISTALDVDLNQNADALSDGIMIIRSLFGFTGNALTDGVVDPGGQRTDPFVIAAFLDNMNPQRELIAPLLTVGLQQDTGLSASDAITFNPTITGTIADINQIVSFTAGFDATPVADFVDVLADLQNTGTYTLTAVRLAQVAGGTLADGMHTLRLRVMDSRGNLATLDRAFTLDRIAPAAPSSDLPAQFDSGVSQMDNVTNVAQPNVTIAIAESGLLHLSLNNLLVHDVNVTPSGFIFTPSLPLPNGATMVTATLEDLAGNVSLVSTPLELQIDTAAPVFSLIDLSPLFDTLPLGDQITTQSVVTLVGTTEPLSTIQVMKGWFVMTATTDGQGNFSVAGLVLALGANLLSFQASDRAGNTSVANRTITFVEDSPVQIDVFGLTPVTWDVDGNGQAAAASDGVLISRYLSGLRGEALTAGIVDPAGTRSAQALLTAYLDDIALFLFDVDDNGRLEASRDGLLIERYLSGLTGTALVMGAVDPSGSRTTPEQILAWLRGFDVVIAPTAPALSAQLAQDTGLSTSDWRTFNPTVTGAITQYSSSLQLYATFDTPTAFNNITQDLQPNHSFLLNHERLGQIAGSGVQEGIRHVFFQAVDQQSGVLSHLYMLVFELDSMAPIIQTTNAPPGVVHASTFSTIEMTFSEPVVPTALTASNFRLQTGQGGMILPTAVQVGAGNRTLNLTYGSLAEGLYQFIIDAASVMDVAGNALGAGTQAQALTIAQGPDVPFSLQIVDRASPSVPFSKAIGDFNADGHLDIVVGGQTGPLVLYSGPTWTKSTIADVGTYESDSSGTAGDIDGDGDVDVSTGGTWFENPGPALAAFGLWQAHFLGAAGTHDTLIVDLDKDGKMDIITRGTLTPTVTLFKQVTPDSWQSKDLEPSVGSEGLAVGDLNNDGWLDVVVGGDWLENPGGEVITKAWVMHTFTVWEDSDAAVGLTDFNGDGRLDVILSVGEGQGHLSWFENPVDARNANWVRHDIEQEILDSVHSLALVDFNRDGQLDIVASEIEGQGRLFIYYNGGQGLTWTRQQLGIPSLHNIRIGDFGQDGDVDIMGTAFASFAPVELWENLSASAVVAPVPLFTASLQQDIAVSVTEASLAEIFTSSETAAVETGQRSVSSALPGDLLARQDDFRQRGRFRDMTGEGMTAVVIDTGIDVDHPFFGLDADHNGVADRIVFQWDFADNDADASDRVGHGSHIASLIGSEDLTYPGVAPEARLLALKVFSDTGPGTFAFVEQALQWVAAHAAQYGIDVVNLSLGDGQNWAAPGAHYGLGDEFAELANEGIFVVAASGNNFFAAQSRPGVSYPAADPNVIGVGAVWTQDFGGPWRWSSGATDLTTGVDRITSFSQRDPTMTEIFAPGARLVGANQIGGTVTMQGTSQAAAYLSGTALLAQQIAEDELGRALTPQEFTTLLMASGQRIVDGDNEQDNVTNTGFTFPRVDMVALADAILALRPEHHDHQWEEHPGRGVEQAFAHRSATGDQHAQGPRFSMPRSGENGHVEHPCADWDSLGDNTSPMSLAQGYTQQAWVRDFVGGVGSVTNATDEEELLIALPG